VDAKDDEPEVFHSQPLILKSTKGLSSFLLAGVFSSICWDDHAEDNC
jgi:hypothetical protein